MKSHVTTKRGDSGETTALNRRTYAKSHPIIECVGNVDELRAHTALIRHLILEAKPLDYEQHSEFLMWLMHTYFLAGAMCSDPLGERPELSKGSITRKHVERLEAEQMRMETTLELPKAFIVSASNTLAAQVDIACTVARRTERSVMRIKEVLPQFDTGELLVYLNRLSDYLFVLARYIEGSRHLSVDYGLLA